LDLAELTGMSPATITNIVSALLREGLAIETGREESNGGRPRSLIDINPMGARFVGVELGETFIRAVLFDFTLEKLAVAHLKVDEHENRPEVIAALVARAIQQVAQTAGIELQNIWGAGVGVPGIVSADGQTSLFAPNWDWHRVPFGEMVQRELQGRLPRLIEANGADVMAIGESWRGTGGDGSTIAILLGTGVGAGIIVGGRRLGGPAEWGHTVVDINGPPCHCGNRGCIEALAGAEAIVRRYRDHCLIRGVDRADGLSADAVISAAQGGDACAIAVLRETARDVGIGVANLINLFSPDTITVNGWIALAAMDIMLPVIRETVQAYALPGLADHSPIVASELGEDAMPMGAAAMIIEHLVEGSILPRASQRGSGQVRPAAVALRDDDGGRA
jgi:predicted NBD/HSP70 family sugar kinase